LLLYYWHAPSLGAAFTKTKKMKRDQVYKAIDTERAYQKAAVNSPVRTDMIEDFHVGDALAAIEVNLQKARREWYIGTAPHTKATEYLRKIAGICVQIGEAYGMPSRDNPNQSK
jgi:hypothetical protein